MKLRITPMVAPVRHQIVERLRTAIIECEFEPGGRLVERELCELMGVSRSSIRESLRQLEAEGLVTMIPHTGPQVATLDKDSTRQIYEIRAVLEGLAARLFVERASEAEVAALQRSVKKMTDRFERGNHRGMRRAWSEFYEALAAGSGNEALSRQLVLLRARAAFARTMLSDERIAQSLREIGAVVAHVKARDAEGAESACVEHIGRAAAATQALLDSVETPSGSAKVL